MNPPDLNLLATLDVLLTEGSVAAAARRLDLSPSAMSRALARLRETTGDPLLVRAGRGLVPTPRAQELREQVRHLVEDARAVLRPVAEPDLGRLERAFRIGSSEGFVESFGAALVERAGRDAPGVRLWFVQKPDRSGSGLRDGWVDLETGVAGPMTGPEIRMRALFSDRFVGVVRTSHPFATSPPGLSDYIAAGHAQVARGTRAHGPVDRALEAAGTARRVVTVVGGFAGALAMARDTDLVATVPERHTEGLRRGLASFPLPVTVPPVTVSLLWHPRMDADPAHRWLRRCVIESCGENRNPGRPAP
ncbi:MAG: LysR family transcriptional regulator [Pseudomonadota bacterium]|nr:LysR family transcriptional regulator [Pseudomonadota bacterium]